MPGFPPSLARTLTDLRMSAIASDRLRDSGESGPDLAALQAGAAAQLEAAGAADCAMLFDAAREALLEGRPFCHGAAVVLLDAAIDTRVEQDFVTALLTHAPSWLAVVPQGDERTFTALSRQPSAGHSPGADLKGDQRGDERGPEAEVTPEGGALRADPTAEGRGLKAGGEVLRADAS